MLDLRLGLLVMIVERRYSHSVFPFSLKKKKRRKERKECFVLVPFYLFYLLNAKIG